MPCINQKECSCLCHKQMLTCKKCIKIKEKNKDIKADTFTSSLRENIRKKSAAPAMKILGVDPVYDVYDRNLSMLQQPTSDEATTTADQSKKTSLKTSNDDKLLKMIERHKKERLRNPFDIDDKMFEFTQNNRFEEAHNQLLAYISQRPELRENSDTAFRG